MSLDAELYSALLSAPKPLRLLGSLHASAFGYDGLRAELMSFARADAGDDIARGRYTLAWLTTRWLPAALEALAPDEAARLRNLPRAAEDIDELAEAVSMARLRLPPPTHPPYRRQLYTAEPAIHLLSWTPWGARTEAVRAVSRDARGAAARALSAGVNPDLRHLHDLAVRLVRGLALRTA